MTHSAKSVIERTLVGLIVALASWSACAGQKLVASQSELSFVSKQMGVPVQGKFQKFDAQVNFDPKKPETGRIAFTVDLASAALGNVEAESELKKATWFDTAKFPKATFQSASIKSLGADRYEVAGKLSIKGNMRDIRLPVTLARQGDLLRASVEFNLNRADFKIGEGEWNDPGLVANVVVVKMRLAIQGMAAG